MPSKVGNDSLKRKRAQVPDKASKRARSESSENEEMADDDNAFEDEILQLESKILESKKNYNNITTLIDRAKSIDEDPDQAIFASVSLCRVFLRLYAAGSLSRKPGQSDRDATVLQWLKARLSEYRKLLVSALEHEESASTALTLAMRLLKADYQNVVDKGNNAAFPKPFLQDIIAAIVGQGFEDVQEEFCEKYVGQFADLRYYTFQSLTDILTGYESRSVEDKTFDIVFDIMSFFEEVPGSVDDLGELYVQVPKKKGDPIRSLQQQKKQAQAAWLALMKLDPNKQQRKKLLEIMADSIAPWFTQPEYLMDFLTDSYNAGGSSALLALSGVFYLIQRRNLDYPAFYKKLYSLLDADILHSKHRSKFLRLLDTFLASTHLPAALVASFIKRLTRLCLSAPPSAIVSIIPWVYNSMKKHPLCTFMMHRVPRTPEEKALLEAEGMEDPFDADEEDPMQTKAIDSCLWEVVQLQSHYHPNVATIAKIISQQFTKQWYNMEDFLDHSYNSLLEAELSKSVKKAPAVEFMIPKHILLPNEPSSGVEDNLLVKLWDFE
ncbi:CBF/Mak21 family-domain-containing protein [Xylariaceae sp. FL1019]|nr:CBF/Mak21 family-domain-containing protein [Xylariaceae sp. FL1019]